MSSDFEKIVDGYVEFMQEDKICQFLYSVFDNAPKPIYTDFYDGFLSLTDVYRGFIDEALEHFFNDFLMKNKLSKSLFHNGNEKLLSSKLRKKLDSSFDQFIKTKCYKLNCVHTAYVIPTVKTTEEEFTSLKSRIRDRFADNIVKFAKSKLSCNEDLLQKETFESLDANLQYLNTAFKQMLFDVGVSIANSLRH